MREGRRQWFELSEIGVVDEQDLGPGVPEHVGQGLALQCNVDRALDGPDQRLHAKTNATWSPLFPVI